MALLRGHTAQVTHLNIVIDGRLASLSSDSLLKVCNVMLHIRLLYLPHEIIRLHIFMHFDVYLVLFVKTSYFCLMT